MVTKKQKPLQKNAQKDDQITDDNGAQISYKRGNSGNVSQGPCGGGAPYCGPRGVRCN